MTDLPSIKHAFKEWYGKLRKMPMYGGLPPKGSVSASLVVLERLREGHQLDIQDHLADGGAQIAGLNLSSLQKILRRYGETRAFPSEGGRTNRGNNKTVTTLFSALTKAGFDRLDFDDRLGALDWMQQQLVQSLDGYYKLERIRFEFDLSKPVRELVHDILNAAQDRQQSGPVAQHLVGAKLALRFPDQNVGNYAYSAADMQTSRVGDFQVGSTAFHVTVAPGLGHVARCGANLSAGFAVFFIVPASQVEKAVVLFETEDLQTRVAVESVESFVGQNLSELAGFASNRLPGQLSALLCEYNRRVGEVETDESLLIEIPAGLLFEE